VVPPVAVAVEEPVEAVAVPPAVEDAAAAAAEQQVEPVAVPKSLSSPIATPVSSLPVLRRTCL
jgi:hypothetical protein